MTTRGADAERVAAAYLRGRGLRLVTRNFRCRVGEIDLIMHDGDTLVFVEVRQRSSDAFGGAAASITATKRRRLLAAAHVYLSRSLRLPPCRFDAVLLAGSGEPDWIRDAFRE